MVPSSTQARAQAAGRHLRKLDRLVRQLHRHDRSRPVYIRGLDEILEIDVEGRTCTAEPGVTFDALVRSTLPYGLVPIVVPELRTITIGGAVAGCSLESTS